MSVIAVAMVRDEVDVIDAWLGHVLTECDGLIVADHGSTDGTRERLSDAPCTTIIDVRDAGYPQQRVVNELAMLAAASGAAWIVPMDADEVWTSPKGRLRDALPRLAVNVCKATVYEHVLSRSEMGPNPFARLPWRRGDPWPWPKVAFRPRDKFELSMGAHEVKGISGPVDTETLVVHHFPVRSRLRLSAKLARWGDLRAQGHLPDGAIIQYEQAVDWEPEDGIVFDPAPLCGVA